MEPVIPKKIFEIPFFNWRKKGKGTINKNDLEQLLCTIGLCLGREEIDEMFNSVAQPNTNELTFEEFKKLFELERAKRVFDEINESKTNFITSNDIKSSFRKYGWMITDNQVRKILARVDKDKDGVISFDEFAEYFQRVPALDVKKVASMWLTSHSHLKRLNECFSRYDSNHDGFLNINELNQAFHALGLCLSDPEVIAIFHIVKKTKENEINCAEFMRIFDVANLCKVFNEIDTKGDGKLDFEEIKSAFIRIGWDLTDYDVMNLITSISVRGSDKIDFEEFLWAFDKLPLLDLHALSHYWLATPVLSEFEGTPLIPFLPNTQQVGTPTNYSVAASVASIVSRSVTNPLERIKIVIQTQQNKSSSTIAIAREIIAKEGYRGLWKGTVASAIRTVPFAAVVGALNGFLLDRVPDKNSALWRFFAIGTAASVASTTTYPLDLIRTRMCLIERPGERSFRSETIPALVELVKTEGIKGAYRGLGPTLLATPLFISLQQTSFEVLAKNYKINQGFSPSISTTIGFGLIAGVFTQTVLFPLEVVRHRMQVQSRESPEYYKGTFHALKKIVVKEGVKGLFRGMWPAYLRVAPNAAISLFIREAVLEWLERRDSNVGHKHEHHHHSEEESKHLQTKHHHTGDDQFLHSPHASLCHAHTRNGKN